LLRVCYKGIVATLEGIEGVEPGANDFSSRRAVIPNRHRPPHLKLPHLCQDLEPDFNVALLLLRLDLLARFHATR
jgi:hypothetical protein